ncbi:hypothetical protein SAMN05661093_06299 [Kibdelosporangium aridum]|uniref:Uncharacterized protein n=1 Tax=Kibdelosporangium aridum TaxID=2030 RepID=A0A1W2FEF8_KIBAR|nr:hypothetical protein SAMN05661093_06299 [Kibdelosporangium aridum]
MATLLVAEIGRRAGGGVYRLGAPRLPLKVYRSGACVTRSTFAPSRTRFSTKPG